MRVLVGDIGATNARFAVVQDGVLGEVRVLPTASDALLHAIFAGQSELTAVCFAVAGPVASNRVSMTNSKLIVDGAMLAAEHGVPVSVINDFTAVSYGLLRYADLLTLGDGEADPLGTRAAIGPGSGCGMGALLHTPAGWMALPSEGGHADLATGSPLEAELWSVLAQTHGQVSWETVLSGPGLVRLYRAVCTVWGANAEHYTPEDVSRHGVQATDAICHQTLETFFAILGTAAGSLAATLYATGGVYIAGGIVPAIADFAAGSALRRRFDERGLMTDLARRIPLHIVRDAHPGLIGAHAYLEEAHA